MAKSDDEYRIRREYEARKEKELAEENGDGDSRAGISKDYLVKLDELLRRAEPLIAQINGSYNQYVAGVEINPPIDRRLQLDQMILTLQMMAKPTAAYRFRYGGVLATYNAFRIRWDKLILDLESGKIQRRVQPRRKSQF